VPLLTGFRRSPATKMGGRCGVKLPREFSGLLSETEFLIAVHVKYAAMTKHASNRTIARDMAKLARLALESYYEVIEVRSRR
jgi:hypothetical protein